MTARFMDVAGTAAWVAEQGPERIIADMASAIETDFRRWEEFEKTPRLASHSAEGVIELMPTSDGTTFSFKYVNGHPANPSRGEQTVTAFGVLADVRNGYPTFVSEMTLLTALRTAATSAMAARALARPDSTTMAMIGTGSQAEFQALGFRSLLGVDRLRVWDVDAAATAKLVRNLVPLGFDIHDAASAADACRDADILTTCTADKTNATVLLDAMVDPGVHINAVGGDCPGKTELDPRILERSRVFVEYAEQTRIEGEIQQLAPDFPVTELWTVLTGSAAGRLSGHDVTVFDSVGFAIEDFSALTYVRDATRLTGHGTLIDLVAEPADPKDLFELVSRPVRAGAA
ncbi:ornithine cyclodeaminase [Nocardioides sp. LHG3406-4]|uniref:ornithine cyclodeaminase n=1 Tax=Nocardioides sp. LHG3406-4 TaxID=2804575 RepID=UPI003CE7835B